jgi:hypothetical protein
LQKLNNIIVVAFYSIMILNAGCGLFDLRDVEEPSNPRSTFTTPTSADIVIANLHFAIAEKNLENYMRCFVDSNFSNKRFNFSPDAASASQFPVFSNWTLNNERLYYTNLLSFTSESASSTLFLSNTTTSTSIDSVVIDADYLLVFDHNKTNVAKTTKGKLRFVLGADSRNLWSVYNWIDFKVNENDTTWSVLKANFSN